MKKILVLTCLLGAFSLLTGEELPQQLEKLNINNRILARVNNRTISVIDVMKKMEVTFARNYPQYADSPAARLQFFNSQWRDTLKQMIDHELILADAEKLELKISDADIREKIHERFGPNIMANLDKIGITYDEAWQMIHSELVVHRMTGYRVTQKAMENIGPQDIKGAYKKHCIEHPAEEIWKYQVLTVRCPEEPKGTEAATLIHQTLLSGTHGFADADKIVQDKQMGEDISVALSNEYELPTTKLSDQHKQILLKLSPGEFSSPVSQYNRIDKCNVQRIFYLKEHTKKETPSFEELSDQLYEDLVQAAMNKEAATYLNKLRIHFDVNEKQIQESIPTDFQPFDVTMSPDNGS